MSHLHHSHRAVLPYSNIKRFWIKIRRSRPSPRNTSHLLLMIGDGWMPATPERSVAEDAISCEREFHKLRRRCKCCTFSHKITLVDTAGL